MGARFARGRNSSRHLIMDLPKTNVRSKMMNENDWDDDLGPVIVRREVYAVAKKYEEYAKTHESGMTDWQLAWRDRDLCRERNDYEWAAFLHQVYEYLMTLECVAYGAKIVVID